MSNPRIVAVTPSVESEVLSPSTVIFWDPTAGPLAGGIHFNCARYFRDAVTKQYFGAPQGEGILTVLASSLVGDTIPVLDLDGNVVSHLPAEVFVGALKGLFDQAYARAYGSANQPGAQQ